MLRVGLTGGIGSGKSTVAGIFEVLNIPVYYADEAARRLMNEDPVIRKGLTEAFGEAVYSNGELNRKYLAGIVFSDTAKLEKLNAITHPAVLAAAANWFLQQKSSYCIKEAALIFESGSHRDLDFVICVSAPAALRIQRVMHRDLVNREDVLQRMKRQLDTDITERLADAVIHNDDRQSLIEQVLQLHQHLIELAKEKNKLLSKTAEY